VLCEQGGNETPSQLRPLAWWPDGSIKWLSVDFIARVEPDSRVTLFLERGAPSASFGARVQVDVADRAITIATGVANFEVARTGESILSARLSNGSRVLDRLLIPLTHKDGGPIQANIRDGTVEEAGPLRATVVVTGDFANSRRCPLRFRARLSFFAERALVGVELTLHNPRAAHHIGNVWDLGDPGSWIFEDASLELVPAPATKILRWRTRPDMPWQEHLGSPWVLYQDSSGGDHWSSTNHIDAKGIPTVAFRGYEVRVANGSIETGERAQPIATAWNESGWIAVTAEDFWQNFPKGLRWREGILAAGIFPAECRAPFEIQGGEKKRHQLWLEIGEPGQPVDLDVAHEPLAVWVDTEFATGSGAITGLAPKARMRDPVYGKYIDSILDGPRSFFESREVVDEYGWRNFGDLYADHEAVGWAGGEPMISHYNNQYDFVLASALHFLRTGDQRWKHLCTAASKHTIDIDIYHTDQDRSAYNGGYFWHTEHYRDAATCTHRSYSRRNGRGSSYGGGPSNEHNYTSGLLTYHYMTGDPEARSAVLELANWVIAMDDGRRTLLGLFTEQPTGCASSTRSLDYQKPGRGAGNSINALLDAHNLSRERRYLFKAEELVRRCIHPRDDVAALQLDDPENRWSYLVFLQVLGKYLDTKVEYGELGYEFFYARDSLIHYATWMLHHEVPFRDVLDKVELPTETWPAQDIRKAHVFHIAAKYSTGEQRSAFAERADFFTRRCIADVLSFETAYLTRPRVLVSVYEPILRSFETEGYGSGDGAHTAAHGYIFGTPEPFTSQREAVKLAVVEKGRTARRELSRLIQDRWARVLQYVRWRSDRR
jgi:hypothetical protein